MNSWEIWKVTDFFGKRTKDAIPYFIDGFVPEATF
jgi:hypothetical protein